MAEHKRTLYDLTDKYRLIEELMGDQDMPEEAILDAIDEIGDAFNEKAIRCARMILNWKADEGSVDAEIKRLQGRKKSLQASQERLEQYLVMNMLRAGVKKIADPETPLSIRGGRLSVIIEDENLLPAELVEARTEFVPLKMEIKKVLDAIDSYLAVLGDQSLTDEARNMRIEAILAPQPEWAVPHIVSGALAGARFQRGNDGLKIG